YTLNGSFVPKITRANRWPADKAPTASSTSSLAQSQCPTIEPDRSNTYTTSCGDCPCPGLAGALRVSLAGTGFEQGTHTPGEAWLGEAQRGAGFGADFGVGLGAAFGAGLGAAFGAGLGAAFGAGLALGAGLSSADGWLSTAGAGWSSSFIALSSCCFSSSAAMQGAGAKANSQAAITIAYFDIVPPAFFEE
ncbi:MAG: hypothetical protein DRP83_01050, partial [Planctomycetota bacterium]